VVDGTTDLNQSYYVFQDEFVMTAGQELNLALTCDVANYATLNADTLIASLQIGTTYPEMKDLNNKTVTNSSSLVPASNITGKTMTASSPSLTVALASTPVSDTFVKGNKDVCFAGFSLTAGDASDVKITEFKVDAGNDTDGGAWDSQNYAATKDIVGSAKLMEGGIQIGTLKSMQTSATAAYVTFDNLAYTIPAGETKLVQVCGDVSSSLATAKGIAFAILATGNITAEDEDGNSVGVSGTANGVTATPTVRMTISQGGTLTLAADADTPKSDIVVAGSSDVEVAKFKISATDEDFIVKKLELTNDTGTNADVTSVKISYTNSEGQTETKTGYIVSGEITYSGLDIFVEADNDTVVTVTANLNTISAGATAASSINFDIQDDGTDPSNFEAVAQGSGETYTGTNTSLTYTKATVDAATNALYVYESKPTVSLASTSPAGIVLVSTVSTLYQKETLAYKALPLYNAVALPASRVHPSSAT
jgi:hypothetical protein